MNPLVQNHSKISLQWPSKKQQFKKIKFFKNKIILTNFADSCQILWEGQVKFHSFQFKIVGIYKSKIN